YAGMAMTDDRDVVVRIEQPPTVGVEQPDALAAYDVNGIRVGQVGERGTEQPPPALCELTRRRRRCRRAEPPRHSVEVGLGEELEQLPRVVVPRLDVVGVLGIALDPPGADRDDR